MAEVHWSQRAERDLREIEDFIRADSAQAARELIDRLVAAAKQLEQFPQLGRVISELNRPDRRELIVGSYRLMYGLSPNGIVVRRVIHGARDVRGILRGPGAGLD